MSKITPKASVYRMVARGQSRSKKASAMFITIDSAKQTPQTIRNMD